MQNQEQETEKDEPQTQSDRQTTFSSLQQRR